MDKKIRITIQVGESRYPLWVEPQEEPIFREAARMVNRRLTAYATKFRSSHLPPDNLMAMAAVDLAVLCQRQTAEPVDTSELTAIVTDLQTFLSKKEEPEQ